MKKGGEGGRKDQKQGRGGTLLPSTWERREVNKEQAPSNRFTRSPKEGKEKGSDKEKEETIPSRKKKACIRKGNPAETDRRKTRTLEEEKKKGSATGGGEKGIYERKSS